MTNRGVIGAFSAIVGLELIELLGQSGKGFRQANNHCAVHENAKCGLVESHELTGLVSESDGSNA